MSATSMKRPRSPGGFIFNYCSYVAMAAVLIIAVNAYLAASITAPQLVMLAMLPAFTATVNMTLFINMVAFRNLKLSKDKLAGILDEQEEQPEDKHFRPDGTEIAFRDVCFSYVEGEPVLSHADFTIPAGKFTALVGDSGSGKSTILNLISKYYDVQEGDVTIGGCSVKTAPSEQVLSGISLVDQDVFLFNDTCAQQHPLCPA